MSPKGAERAHYPVAVSSPDPSRTPHLKRAILAAEAKLWRCSDAIAAEMAVMVLVASRRR
jgi:hypothetical protein